MTGTSRQRLGDYPPYRALTADTVVAYLASVGVVNTRLGGSASGWIARECGDGNLNLVFIVKGGSGAIVVKQALPYVRMVGESWPLSVRRNFYEHAALLEQSRWAAPFVPAIYHVDEDMALMAMEYLTPHVVLRSEFIAGRMHPRAGEHLGRFLAATLFNTSNLRLSALAKKERSSVFVMNCAMCRISEDLIFDEPYFAAPMNRHTAPQLDGVAASLRSDADLKIAVQTMKWRFTNQSECLLHGDLHTGSVMVTADETRVIDAEFACYGPMGFDIGVLLANFLMAHLSQPGHATRSGGRFEFQTFLLQQLTKIWTVFEAEFSTLWRERPALAEAAACNPRLDIDSPAFSEGALAARLRQIWDDALGFAGCEMIRRIVGLAHVADFETIADPDRRAACEKRAVALARELLLTRGRCPSVSQLTAMARDCE